MKTFKKTLSLILAVCLIASVFAVAAVTSASANYGDATHNTDIKDAVPADKGTKTIYFYMPDEWRNKYNDTYDGSDLASCSAGIYWWDTSLSPKEFYGDTRNAWPGYNVTEKAEGQSNIFVARCPEDTATVIWNNTVDGGETADKEKDPERYSSALQTSNLTAEFYSPEEDGYGFYPNGTTTVNNMIFVCNLKDTEVNDFSGKTTYKGAWFYYYGSGKYGKYETLADAEANNAVFENGAWPGGDVAPATEPTTDPSATVDPSATTVDPSATTEPATTVDPSATTEPATTVDPSATTVDPSATTEPATTVEPTEATTAAPATDAPKAEKKNNTMTVKAKKVTVKAKALKKKAKTVKAITVKNAVGKVSYKKAGGASKIKVNAKNGKLKIAKKTKKGTYKVTVKVTAAGNASFKPATKSVKVTIKVK